MQSAQQELANHGAIMDSYARIGEQCEVVFTILPDAWW